MKLRSNTSLGRRSQRGFTLPELTVAIGIFLLMITGVISSHIFGLKMYEIARVKLGASDKARKAISALSDEIRRAKIVKVGTITSGVFKEVGLNLPQQGNVIQIYTTSDPNKFVRYFRDTDQALKRMSNNLTTVVAASVTNKVVFTKENATGTILTNDMGKYVVGMTLQFCDLDFMSASSSSNNLYDNYELKTKITPRN